MDRPETLSVITEKIKFSESKNSFKLMLAQISPSHDPELAQKRCLIKTKDPEFQRDKILSIIDEAKSKGTDMLLFPELIAPFKHLNNFEERLKDFEREFIAVIPYEHTPLSEFIEILSPDEIQRLGIIDTVKDSRWVNFCRITLRRKGDFQVYTQIKLTPFSGEFSMSLKNTLFCGKAIFRFITNWGNFIVLICKDYLGEIRREKKIPMFNFLKELLDEAELHHIFVCALNQDAEAFLHAARSFYYMEEKTQNTYTTFLNVSEYNHTITVFPKSPHPRIRMDEEVVKVYPLFTKKPSWGTYLDFEGFEEKTILATFVHLKDYIELPTKEIFSPVYGINVNLLSEPVVKPKEPLLSVSICAPEKLLVGEAKKMIIKITNKGRTSLRGLELLIGLPRGLSIISGERCLIGEILPDQEISHEVEFKALSEGDYAISEVEASWKDKKGITHKYHAAQVGIKVEPITPPELRLKRIFNKKIIKTKEPLEITYVIENKGNTGTKFVLFSTCPSGFIPPQEISRWEGEIPGYGLERIKFSCIAIKDGEYEFPEAELIYKDPEGVKYVVKTHPISIKVVLNLETELVNREKELKRIVDGLEMAESGAGKVVFLGGQAGIGKTRLVKETMELARKRGVKVIQGSCYEASGPYHSMREMLWDYFELEAGDIRESAFQKIMSNLSAISKDWENMTSFFTNFVTTTIEETQKAKEDELFFAVSKLLIAAATQKPLFLFIDDLQWIDPNSAALLEVITRSIPNSNIFIIGTYRSEAKDIGEANPSFNELLRSISRLEHFERWEMGPLSSEDISKMIELTFGEGFPYVVKQKIVEKVGGNPLFLKEILENLIKEGYIQRSGDEWIITEIDLDSLLPAKIYDLVLSRVSRLEDRERNLIDYASAIGLSFNLMVLMDAMDLPEDEFLKAMVNLEALHFVEESEDDPEVYSFTHRIIQETVYQQIKGLKRRIIHKKIGNAMERVFANEIGRVVDDLARQFTLALDKTKAVQYLVQAGDKAARNYAAEHAAWYYEEALKYKESSDILEKMGNLFISMGKYDKAIDRLKRALELSEDIKSKARITRTIGRAFGMKGKFDEALQMLSQSIELIGDTDTTEKGLIDLEKAVICRKKGELDAAITYYEEAIDIFERHKNDLELSNALNLKGLIHWSTGDYDGALEAFLKSIEIKESVEDPVGIAGIWSNIGLIYGARSEWSKAIDYTTKAKEILEKRGIPRALANALSNLGNFYHMRGDLEEMLKYTKEALKIREKIGDRYGIDISYTNLGEYYREKGELDKAMECFQKSLEIAESINDREGIAFVNLGISNILNREGKHDEALQYCEKALTFFRNIQGKEGMCNCYLTLSEINLNKKNIEEAESFCEKAFLIAKEIGSKLNEAHCFKIFGMIYREKNNWEVSAKNFEESIRLYKEIETKIGLGRTYFEYGIMLKRKGEINKAREFMEYALKIFEEKGLEKYKKKL